MEIKIASFATFIHVTIFSAFVLFLVFLFPYLAFLMNPSALVYLYIPIALIAISSYLLGTDKKLLTTIIVILLGLVCTFMILYLSTPTKIETDGGTTIVRHSGPSLQQAYDWTSYIFPLILMSISIKIFWFSLDKETSKQKANKSLKSDAASGAA